MPRKYKKTGNHSNANVASRFYTTWSGMFRRCHDPKFHKFYMYGERGIAVCQEWRDSAAAFIEWAESTFVEGCTLDRHDNDGDYSPGNCRWATPGEQVRNTRQGKRASQYVGVRMKKGKWWARIEHKGVRYRLGRFKTEIEAARARDAKAIELGLPPNLLNFPPA